MKSRLEIMAEERDYKRRRQSYKGGKTGSVKRSYTEVSSENMGSLYVLVLVYFFHVNNNNNKVYL